MLSDAEIEDLIAALPARRLREDALAGLLNRVKCCPLCFELFLRRKDLSDHLGDHHTNELSNPKRYEIKKHEVSDGAKKIYICKFCGYAVSDGGWQPPTSHIMTHIESCPEYRKVALFEFEHKSYWTSEDKDLIRAYLEGHAEIELFGCPFCNDTYRSHRSLLLHLAQKHSNTEPESLPNDQRDRIENLFNRRTEGPNEPAEPVRTNVGASLGPPEDPLRPGLAIRTNTEGQERVERPTPTVIPPEQPTDNPMNDAFTRTLLDEEIDKGYCDLPLRLRTILGLRERIVVAFRGGGEESLAYDRTRGRLFGLGPWYLGNAVEPSDKILFRLLDPSPPRIQLWTEWNRNLDQLLRCPPEDFEWEELPIRDCLLRVFAECAEPLYYRTLYAEISKHRDLTPKSVLGTLSKYRGILFELEQRGMWMLLKDDVRSAEKGDRPPVSRSPQEADDQVTEVWLKVIVADIENHDLVYKLLRCNRQDMSFNQICQKIADHYRIDWRTLSATGFFNPSDVRFKRLTNGNFVLSEWLKSAEGTCQSDQVYVLRPEIFDPIIPAIFEFG